MDDNIEFRFIISSKNATHIIGHNGCNIKRLHKQFCAVINITHSQTVERILTISGSDVKALCCTLEDILIQLHTFGHLDESSINLLLDDAQVEYLTSYDVQQLNDILEDSGTLIDVFLLTCPSSNDRVIRVRGQPTNIVQCIYCLYDLLQWFPVKHPTNPYNADNADEVLASDYGGFTKPQEQTLPISQSAEEESAKDTEDSQSESSMADEPVKICEDPMYVEQFLRTCASDIIDSYPLQFNKEKSRMSGNDSDDKKCFTLPLYLLRLVLGDRGSRLHQISKESNVQIEIKLMNDKPHECLVVLFGTNDEVANARHLINMCIQMMCSRVL